MIAKKSAMTSKERKEQLKIADRAEHLAKEIGADASLSAAKKSVHMSALREQVNALTKEAGAHDLVQTAKGSTQAMITPSDLDLLRTKIPNVHELIKNRLHAGDQISDKVHRNVHEVNTDDVKPKPQSMIQTAGDVETTNEVEVKTTETKTDAPAATADKPATPTAPAAAATASASTPGMIM